MEQELSDEEVLQLSETEPVDDDNIQSEFTQGVSPFAFNEQEISDDQLQASQQAAAPAQPERELSDSELFRELSDEEVLRSGGQDLSELGARDAFVTAAASHGAPTLGGLAAGAMAGGAIGAALGGPAAPITSTAGAVVGGLAAGVGAGHLIQLGQDKLLELLGWTPDIMSQERRAHLSKEHEIAYEFGRGTPITALLRPGGTILERVLSGGIGVGAEAGATALAGEEQSLGRMATAGVMGALLPNFNRRGEQLVNQGRKLAGHAPLPSSYDAPAPNPPAATEAQIQANNQTPNNAAGVATSQSAPSTQAAAGTGNEGTAAGAAHVAAKPKSKERDYTKSEERAVAKAERLGVFGDIEVQVNQNVTSENIAKSFNWKMTQPEIRQVRSWLEKRAAAEGGEAVSTPVEVVNNGVSQEIAASLKKPDDTATVNRQTATMADEIDSDPLQPNPASVVPDDVAVAMKAHSPDADPATAPQPTDDLNAVGVSLNPAKQAYDLATNTGQMDQVLRLADQGLTPVQISQQLPRLPGAKLWPHDIAHILRLRKQQDAALETAPANPQVEAPRAAAPARQDPTAEILALASERTPFSRRVFGTDAPATQPVPEALPRATPQQTVQPQQPVAPKQVATPRTVVPTMETPAGPMSPKTVKLWVQLRRAIADNDQFTKVVEYMNQFPPAEQMVKLDRAIKQYEADVRIKEAEDQGVELVQRPTGEVRKPGSRDARISEWTGKQAATPELQQRNERVMENVIKWYDEYAPGGTKTPDIETMSNTDLSAWAVKTYDNLTERLGHPWLKKNNPNNYIPSGEGPHTPAKNFAQALRNALPKNKGGNGAYGPLREILTLGPASRDAELNKIIRRQEIDKINTERRMIANPGAEDTRAVVAPPRKGIEVPEDLPPMRSRGGELAKDQTYRGQENALRQYLRSLDDADRAYIVDEYGSSIKDLLTEPANPLKMLSEFKELVEAPRRKNITGARYDLKPVVGKDTSVVEAENSMRQMLNDLPKDDYALLKAEYSYRHGKNLRQEVEDPLDPADLHDKLRGILQRAKDTEKQINELHAEATKGEEPKAPAQTAEELSTWAANFSAKLRGLAKDEEGALDIGPGVTPNARLAAQLREAGVPLQEIADKLGVSTSRVSQLSTQGGFKPPEARGPRERDLRAHTMRLEGKTLKEIGQELGVTPQRARDIAIRGQMEANKPEPGVRRARLAEMFAREEDETKKARKFEPGERRARLAELFKKLAKDEEGGIPVGKAWPKWFSKTSATVHKDPVKAKQIVTDEMRQSHLRFSDSLQKSFGDTDRKIMGLKDRGLILEKEVNAAEKPSTAENDSVLTANEILGGRSSLTGKAKEWNDRFVDPNRRSHANDYQFVYNENKAHNYGWPLADPSRVFRHEFMPHILKKMLRNTGDDDVNNPMIRVGRNYSPWNERMEPRVWKEAIDPATGKSFVIKLDKDSKGNWQLERWEDGKITGGKGIKFDDNFDGEVGSAFAANWDGTEKAWIVDHGRVREIKKATGGEVDFVDDPVLAFAMAAEQMAISRAMLEQINAVKTDPRFKKGEMWTDDEKFARERGWVETRLPQFAETRGLNKKTLYYPKNVAWVFDDVYKKGWSTEGHGFIEGMREVNTALAKIFNTYGPLIHPLNLLNQYTISRGFDWLKPKEYKNLAVHAANAFREVNSGVDGPLQRRFHAAGGHTLLRTVYHRGKWERVGEALGVDIIRDPKPWDLIAKMFGKTTSELVDKLHDFAGDITWRSSDYLALMKFQDNIAKGMTDVEAVADVKKWIPDYQIASTVIGKGDKSRALQQFLMDPLTVAFGPWKYAVFKTYAHMFKDAFKGTPKEQDQALGQWLAFMGMAFIAYPMLDKAAQLLTGNEKAKFSRRGGLGTLEGARRFAQGEAGVPLSNVVTPSFVLTAGHEAITNQTWGGKPIIPTLDWKNRPVDSAITGVGHAADWAARTAIEPYDIFSREVKQNRGDIGKGAVEGAKAIALDQVGIREPSRGAARWLSNKDRKLWQEERARRRADWAVPSALRGVKKGVVDWFEGD